MNIQFSSQSAYSMGSMSRPQLSKDQLSEAAGNLFGKLDTESKGYLEQSDFSSLLSGLQSEQASAKSEELFTSLDSDGDGQLTSSEFSDNFSNLLYSAQGTMGSMGSRPPPPEDSGKSKDELTAMLEEMEQEDETASSGLESLLENFDTADTDGDGKVTMQEAMAYKESTAESSESSSGSTQGMMPPPPPPGSGMGGGMGNGEDTGKTAEELAAMLEDISETDSDMSAGLQTLIDNFDSADADGDGKVTMQEANSFRESQQTESSSLASKVSTGSDQSESISKLLSRTMQQLMDTYGGLAKINAQSGSAVNITA